MYSWTSISNVGSLLGDQNSSKASYFYSFYHGIYNPIRFILTWHFSWTPFPCHHPVLSFSLFDHKVHGLDIRGLYR